MNIIELQDNLKDFPDRVLMQEMQSPSGNMPQFLVLSELTRRKRMREDYKRQEAANMPTVAEEVMTAAGAPQEGLTAIARNMAPNSSIAQNTSADMAVQREPTRMPQMMAEGGLVGLASGGAISVQPTGGGNYILVQNGERVQGTGVYPDFESADAASRAIRGVQPFQVPRVLADEGLMPSPMVMDDGPSLQEINPDPTAFAANDEIRRSLQMRQAMGDFRDPSTDLDIGGILAGAQQFDFDRPFAQQDATGGLPVAAPDFDATDENDILDAEEARLVQQEVLDANRGDQPLPDISQIDPETNLDISAALGIGSLGTNLADAINNPIGDLPFLPPPARDTREPKESTLSGDNFSNDPTQGYSYPTDVPPVDPSMEGMTVLKRLAEVQGGSLSEDIYGGYTDPEAIARRQQRERMLELEPLGEGMQKDVSTVLSEADQVSQAGVMPEMPIDPSSVMPPVLRDLDITDNTTIESISGDQGNVGSMMPTGGDSYGALESRIAQMLADREKSAESDKYLALAQAGLALMASDKPTLGAALGEAGLVGISQLREARNQYDKDILGLLSTQADIDAARRDASLAERRLGLQEREVDLAEEELRSTSGLTSKKLNEMIDDNRAYLNTLQSEAKSYRRVAEGDEALGTIDRVIDMTPPELRAQIIAVSERLQELERMRSGQNVQFDATATQ